MYIPCPELPVEGLEPMEEEPPVCGLETDPPEGALAGLGRVIPPIFRSCKAEYEESIEGAILGSGDMCVVGNVRGV